MKEHQSFYLKGKIYVVVFLTSRHCLITFVQMH